MQPLRHEGALPPDNASRMRENIGHTRRKRAGEHLHEMLMDSRKHREAILDPSMTTFGIGVVEHKGRIWVTQRFTNALVR